MTIFVYSKKDDKYKPLSVSAIKKLKQADEVKQLKSVAQNAIPTINALAAWLGEVNRRGNKLSSGDLAVARTPNCKRLSDLALQLARAVDDVRG